MKAFLLCAGMGTRLKPFTINKHKAFLPIGGEILIERNIEYLHSKDIHDITIVVGHLSEQFEYLVEKYNVKLVLSTLYQTHNNYTSMQLVVDQLGDSIVMEGDIYFTEDVISLIDPSKNQYFCQEITHGTEWGLDLDKDNRIKNIDTTAKTGWGIIGISYWTGSIKDDLREELNKCSQNEYWDHAIMRLINSHNIYANKSKKKIALEFDTVQDILYSNLLTLNEILWYIQEEHLAVDSIGISNNSYYNNEVFIKIFNKKMNNVVDRDLERKFKNIFNVLGLTPKTFAENYDYSIVEKIHGIHPRGSEYFSLCLDALKPIHDLPHSEPHNSMKVQIENYLSLCPDKNIRHQEIEDLIINKIDHYPTNICHGDLVIENMILCKDKLFFIDFEYACCRSKYWDIATLYLEFDKEMTEEILIEHAIAIDYIWYLWSMMDFKKENFYSYGIDRLNRALKNFKKLKEL